MTGVYLFDLVSQQAHYLAVRQSMIAGNVANANTQDYKARDIIPFAEIMARTATASLSTTASGHLNAADPSFSTTKIKASDAWDRLSTSSSVSLEQEMLKAAEISRAHSLNVAITKAFDRMLTLSIKNS
ncbi:flagellar basal body rod protein FlgB [Methylobacterium nonmethylotrophicum]|uniref:Flagellar basal body rod protein FlgB n=1 Tax=Methylobacterium nonmethylotrophicum TaxID=1141884 RepID=A0A4Z0NHM9_9HYPH|nr:flagellar basal body rod protein FlgB [Methylobacterium nonmethylotrophicum]TGD95177.1 flagellar basal body rod protein FlgB [Methylobacterium nonmethylotrophicum]